MQSSSPTPDISKRSELGHHGNNLSLNKPLLMSRLSTRNLYEVQVKSADYEAMMQRFQLRRVSNSAVASEDRTNSIEISTEDATQGKTHLFSFWELVLWLTRRRTWRHAWKFVNAPIRPGGSVCTLHGLFVFGLNHFEFFYLPFSFTFYPKGSTATVCTGTVIQFMHLVDLVLNLNTAFIRQRELVTSRSAIALDYITKWFPLELLSAMPVDIAYVFLDGSDPRIREFLLRYDAGLMGLRMFRLVSVEQSMLPKRLLRNKHLISWLRYSWYSHLLGIAKLIWLVLLVTHYMACFWHKVSAHSSASVGEHYVEAFYYTVQLIQGQGSASGSWEEHLFSICVILIGSVILAIVFGNVAMLVSNFNANTTSYRQKMEAVFATMDKMALPLKLRERVHQYYTHVWAEYKSLDGDIVKFQRELAHTLGLEVGLYKYMDLVMKIPFWESCSPNFATHIILNLTVRVYLPDDYVVRKGETGDEMFMINRGICELTDPEKAQKPTVDIIPGSIDTAIGSVKHDLVSQVGKPVDGSSNSSGDDTECEETDAFRQIPEQFDAGSKLFVRRRSLDKRGHVYPHKNSYEIDPDDKRLTSSKKPIVLYPGQAFGEMSLLMNYKRTANIRAATYVEICVFDRLRFQQIISRYPDDRRLVLTLMVKSCIEKKEIPFPWEEVVDAVTERRAQSGENSASLLDVHSTITSAEAAQALVDRIDIDKPDESIKYGFQTFHPDLKPASRLKSARARINSSASQRLPVQNVTRCDASTDTMSSVEPKCQSIAESRVQNLEKSLADMVHLMTSMAANIERLEKCSQGHEEVCCRCSEARSIQEDSRCLEWTGAIICPSDRFTTGANGASGSRKADYTTLPPSPDKKLRRPSSNPNMIPNTLELHDKIVDNKFRSGQICRGIRQREAADSPAKSATKDKFHRQNDSHAAGGPKHIHNWITLNKSPTKKSTLADQLWYRQVTMKDRKKLGGGGKNASITAKTDAQPCLIRTRSNLPSNLELGFKRVVEPCLTRTRSNLPLNLDVPAAAFAVHDVAEPALTRTRSSLPSNLQIECAAFEAQASRHFQSSLGAFEQETTRQQSWH